MPTNQNVYNTRVTDEALEKRFRDTFRSQGGAELVDDLYAQGVIVPVVDFTAAATGEQLAQNLQTAWDFTTGANQLNNASANLITNAGFWQVDLTCTSDVDDGSGSANNLARVEIFDGTTAKPVWALSSFPTGGVSSFVVSDSAQFVVFLRSGDILRGVSSVPITTLDVWYRQIATISGDLINPSGFTSS